MGPAAASHPAALWRSDVSPVLYQRQPAQTHDVWEEIKYEREWRRIKRCSLFCSGDDVANRRHEPDGLGIPLLKLAAEMAEGGLSLVTESGKGTKVEASFRHSHIDRMPLGDIAVTFLTLLISYPHIHWVFDYRVIDRDGESYEYNFDDTELKAELGDMRMTEPDILKFVRGMFEEGIEALALQTVN
jgi:hypothetical protein